MAITGQGIGAMHTMAEIHASGMRCFSKVEASEDPVYKPTRSFIFPVKCEQFGISGSLPPVMKGIRERCGVCRY